LQEFRLEKVKQTQNMTTTCYNLTSTEIQTLDSLYSANIIFGCSKFSGC